MFEGWICELGPPTRKIVEPALPVLVDLSVALNNPDDAFRRDVVPMRIKLEGISTNSAGTLGILHAWIQTTAGGWWGLVTFDLSTGNGRGRLTMRQWCPARSLKPAPTGGPAGPPVATRPSDPSARC
ncbi:Uncharacterised protein [Mycobacteroides abscessus subsp. abscessus]|nr:Uncharacterised protein [Mycobacteroides abscessus subsp. abscessus]